MEHYTVETLKSMSKGRGLRCYSKLRKAKFIDLLQQQQQMQLLDDDIPANINAPILQPTTNDDYQK